MSQQYTGPTSGSYAVVLNAHSPGELWELVEDVTCLLTVRWKVSRFRFNKKAFCEYAKGLSQDETHVPLKPSKMPSSDTESGDESEEESAEDSPKHKKSKRSKKSKAPVPENDKSPEEKSKQLEEQATPNQQASSLYSAPPTTFTTIYIWSCSDYHVGVAKFQAALGELIKMDVNGHPCVYFYSYHGSQSVLRRTKYDRVRERWGVPDQLPSNKPDTSVGDDDGSGGVGAARYASSHGGSYASYALGGGRPDGFVGGRGGPGNEFNAARTPYQHATAPAPPQGSYRFEAPSTPQRPATPHSAPQGFGKRKRL